MVHAYILLLHFVAGFLMLLLYFIVVLQSSGISLVVWGPTLSLPPCPFPFPLPSPEILPFSFPSSP